MSPSSAAAYVEVDDATLAARAAHDFEAFEELYRRHLDPVYRFVRSQSPDVATAEDLTAQVFLNALSAARTYRGDGSYRSWLFRIAHNVISTWRASHRRAVAVAEPPEEMDPGPSPAAQAISRKQLDVVMRAVADLPPAQREVVALRSLEDLSTDEIARITRRSGGAVRILLHRARSRLKSVLAREGLL
jgi:RNA polymerase sigma factor (sigma-70 family)